MKVFFVPFCVLLLSFFHSGESLHCYACNSADDPSCLDGSNLGEKLKFDCNSETLKQFSDTFNSVSHSLSQWSSSNLGVQFDAPKVESELACQKIRYLDNADNKEHVIRSCVPVMKSSENACALLEKSLKATNNNGQVDCTQCQLDYCNSSLNLTPQFFSLFTLIATVLYFNY